MPKHLAIAATAVAALALAFVTGRVMAIGAPAQSPLV